MNAIRYLSTSSRLNEIIQSKFVKHPFEKGFEHLTDLQVEAVMKKYLAVLQTFPLAHEKSQSNGIKDDLRLIFEKDITADQTGATAIYLKKLSQKLASSNEIVRTSMSTAYEMHADIMKRPLRISLLKKFDVEGLTLTHFDRRNEKAAEIKSDAGPRFYKEFEENYRMHHEWVASILDGK